MRRMAFWGRLKKSCVKKYIEYHDNIWPELVEAYREAGVRNLSLFISGVDVFGYYELDENVTEEQRAKLRNNPVEARWQELMASFHAKSQPKEQPREIFHRL